MTDQTPIRLAISAASALPLRVAPAGSPAAMPLAVSPSGIKGEKGDPGTPGAAGADGAPGMPGTPGTQGPPGSDGAPGAAGADGADGADGQSAYQIAVALGYAGSEAQWLASLQGPQGPQGPAGADGVDGAPGAPGTAGTQGPPGADGADGQSAYQIAVALGYAGSEAQWLASLQGPQGPQGPAGADGVDGAPGAPGTAGTQGPPGADGADGQSAYQIAVALGYIGSEAQWLASLQGTQGPQGPAGADGVDGAPGAPGTPGTQGPPGADGAPGAPGADGADGASPFVDSGTVVSLSNRSVHVIATDATMLLAGVRNVALSDYGYAGTTYGVHNPAAPSPTKELWGYGAEAFYPDTGVVSGADFYIYNSMSGKYNVVVDANDNVGIGGTTIWGGGFINGAVIIIEAATRHVGINTDDPICPMDVNGAIRGASLDLTSVAPGAPAANTVRLLRKDVGGRQMPAFIGPAGLEATLQPFLGRNKVAYWTPPGNATTAPSAFGMAAPTATGTATARNVATTNMLTGARRLGYVSAATAGALAGVRLAAAQLWRGNAAKLGGFHIILRWGTSDATTVAGARQFCGLSASVAAPTNVEPNTVNNVFGVGQLSTSNNLHLITRSATAATTTDLGANFPANTLSADLYELALFAAPNAASIFYRLERLNTGHVAEGEVTTNLPVNTTLMGLQMWRSNNATAAAVGIDLVSAYVETDN